MSDIDEALERLWEVSRELNRDIEGLAWFPLICKKCEGPVAQKMASHLAVCLKCGCEFYMVPVSELDRLERILRE